MDSVLSGGQYAEIRDACAQRFSENETAEAPVTGKKYPAVFLCCLEQILITGLWEPDLSY